MDEPSSRSIEEPDVQAFGGRHPTVAELREEAGGRPPDTVSHLFALWFSLLGPPIAWAIQLVLSDGFSELGCRAGGFSTQALVLIAITVVTAAVSVLAGVLALRNVHALRRDGVERETSRQRIEFMAEGGVVSSVLFTLLIVMGGMVPRLILKVCGV